MQTINVAQVKSSYDVIIVGSGAAGGQVAYTVTMGGAKALMLEAGRAYDPASETPMFQRLDQAPLRGVATPDREGYNDFYTSAIGGTSIPGEPYTNAKDRRPFRWYRSRMLGGRTNHWNGVSLRYSPADFRLRTLSGVGIDWPMAYEELAPYYDKVEMLVGIFGDNESRDEDFPHSPAGVLLPPPKPRAGELYLKKHAESINLQVVAAHRAILSKALDHERISRLLHPGNAKAQRILAADMKQRSPCFWATDCFRGCSIRAKHQSTTVQIPPALATGNLDILPDAMVREITVDASGKATGVVYVDKRTGAEHRVSGRIVVVAGGAYESVRLLMNSRSNRFPDGIGNSSGMLGRYLNTNAAPAGFVTAHIPMFEKIPPHDEFGAGGDHVFIPWWLSREQKAGKLDFPRSYQYAFHTSRDVPPVASELAKLEPFTAGKHGRALKEAARRHYGSFISFRIGAGNMPDANSFCTLDPVAKDRWGIPALQFHWGNTSDLDLKLGAHARRNLAQLIDAMGGRVLSSASGMRDAPMPTSAAAPAVTATDSPGGYHEQGGAVLGSDPGSSVLNKWCQTWDVKNVFVTDGAAVGCNAAAHPTLTIMAMSWRAGDYMLEQMHKRNL